MKAFLETYKVLAEKLNTSLESNLVKVAQQFEDDCVMSMDSAEWKAASNPLAVFAKAQLAKFNHMGGVFSAFQRATKIEIVEEEIADVAKWGSVLDSCVARQL